MAILTLNHDIDDKIAYVCEKIFEIEYLLEEGPHRLEAYNNALNILKMNKRGIPLKDAANTWQTECCPPGKTSNEDCVGVSCSDCWACYIETLQPTENTKDAKQ